jgi:hypothetical protein
VWRMSDIRLPGAGKVQEAQSNFSNSTDSLKNPDRCVRVVLKPITQSGLAENCRCSIGLTLRGLGKRAVGSRRKPEKTSRV